MPRQTIQFIGGPLDGGKWVGRNNPVVFFRIVQAGLLTSQLRDHQYELRSDGNYHYTATEIERN